MSESVLDAVRGEIERMHVSFVEWFRGTCDNDDETFRRMFESKFVAEALYILPAGKKVTMASFLPDLRSIHGTSPHFRILIRDVVLIASSGSQVVAHYTEWQKGCRNSTPPQNGRQTTVVFECSEDTPLRLRWRHIHETWLTTEEMEKGPFTEF